jgi:hypothetical protein
LDKAIEEANNLFLGRGTEEEPMRNWFVVADLLLEREMEDPNERQAAAADDDDDLA